MGLLGLAPGARLLDAGCGDGRIAVRLASLGYRVVAVDADAAQLDRARRSSESRGVQLELLQLELSTQTPDGLFDGAFLWFNTWGFGSDEANEGLLATVASVLEPGAPLVIDTLDPAAVSLALFEEDGPVAVEIEGDLQVDRSHFDAEAGRLVTLRETTVAGRLERRLLRLQLLDPEAWRQALDRHGLELEQLSSRAGAPLDGRRLELVLLARRR